MKKKPVLLMSLLIIFTINSCAQSISRNLESTIKDNNICIFTNNEKTYSNIENSYLIFVAEVTDSKDFKTVYEKTYSKGKFPILKDDCALIPLNIFKINKPYDVNLESNKNFSTQICISETGKILPVSYVSPGKAVCSQ